MRRPLAVALIASGVLAAPAFAATKSVTVGDNWFVRSSGVPKVTVNKGTTVVWRFRGDAPHDVRVSSGPVKFKSAPKVSGSFKRKMTTRGTYKIYCSIHGASDQSMRLVVK